MSLESESRVKSLINAVNTKTGFTHLNIKSAVQVLCNAYNAPVGSDTIVETDNSSLCESVNCIENLIKAANRKTYINHTNLTHCIQTLFDGYRAEIPTYSFGITSDIHLQYETGISDFQRALAYFEKQNIPFSCVCGDLTWAGKMVNAEQYTSEWVGGLADYKNVIGNRTNVYAIGGNHECYTATYDVATQKWTSVDNGFDRAWFEENTGCAPFYTISSEPDDDLNHNVYCSAIPETDIFIMLSIKHATAPNLFFTEADGEDEFVWLQNVLEVNKQKRCFVFFHEHDNADKAADPFGSYPHGISESTDQGRAFIDLMRRYNVIWFHGHTHTTFEMEHPPVATQDIRGYRTVNVPSTQGPRKFINSTGDFTGSSTESEGFIVDVYNNYIVLKALDFSSVNADGTGSATIMEVYALETPYAETIAPNVIESISATFTQGNNIVYDTDSLDALKSMLVVTANWSNGSVTTLSGYTLSGALAVGTSTITVTYEDKTATFSVTVTAKPKYTNQIPISVDASGKPYVGTNGEKGYKENQRLSSSGAESGNTGTDITGFIPAKLNDVLRFKNCQLLSTTVDSAGYNRIFFYKSDFTKIGYTTVSLAASIVWEWTFDANSCLTSIVLKPPFEAGIDLSSLAYVRVCANNIDATSIITVNEEIDSSSGSSPVNTVESIAAIFTQGSTIIYNDTSLDSLKPMLVVTATWKDGTTSNVTDYTLSGTLSTNTSAITVTYEGKTTTFSVTVTTKPKYTNQVPLSIDTDGSIYKGKGYQEHYRLNSSGAVTAQNNAIHSGFIPYTVGSVIRAKGSTVATNVSGHYIACYDANFNCLKSATSSSMTSSGKYGSYVQQADGKYLLTVSNFAPFLFDNFSIDVNNIKYIRVSMPTCTAADFIVTLDEEIE